MRKEKNYNNEMIEKLDHLSPTLEGYREDNELRVSDHLIVLAAEQPRRIHQKSPKTQQQQRQQQTLSRVEECEIEKGRSPANPKK